MRAIALLLSLTLAGLHPDAAIAVAAQAPVPHATAGEPMPTPLERFEARRASAIKRSHPSATREGSKPEAVPGELLVRFVPGTPASARSAAAAAVGAERRAMPSGLSVLRVPVSDVARTQRDLAADPRVAVVAPNYVRRAAVVPTDPMYPQQQPALGLLNMERAWNRSKGGPSTSVAVIDSGIDADHPDLVGQVVKSLTVVGGTTDDVLGHGTQVGGLISAHDNSIGITGVAPNARLLSIRVLDENGTTTDAALDQAIRTAVGEGADVINLSLGGPGLSQVLWDAVEFAQSMDVVVVAAAGNDGSDVPYFPASLPGVISVAATDNAGDLAAFSNHGLAISLAAPGVSLPTTDRATGPAAAYSAATGTSFSAPLVSGLAALLRSEVPGIHAEVATWTLLRTARDRGAPGLDDAFGFGIPDAAAALGIAPVAPPSSPTPSGGDPNGVARDATLLASPTATDSISPEGDEDWFAIDLSSPKRVTARITPPAFSGGTGREMDPIVALYDSNLQLVDVADTGFIGDVEEVAANMPAGRTYLHVRSYLGSQSAGPYQVQVAQTAWAPDRLLDPAYLEPHASDYEDTVVADVNDDGRDDLVATTGHLGVPANTIEVRLQAVDGTLGAPSHLPTHNTYANGGSLVGGDLDGDGDDDISVSLGNGGADVLWQEDGGLTAAVAYSSSSTGGATAVDIDGDLDLEVVQGWQYGWEILDWDPTGAVTVEAVTIPGMSSGGPGIAAGDLDGDGSIDLARTSSAGLYVASRDADGWAVAERAYPHPGSPQAGSIAIGDVQGDGRDELVLAANPRLWIHEPALEVIALDGSGSLELVEVVRTMGEVDEVVVERIDGDSRDDITVLHRDEAEVGTYLSGAGLGVAHEIGSSAVYGVGLSVGDIDDNGLADVVIAAANPVVLRRAPLAATPFPDPMVTDFLPAPLVVVDATPTDRATTVPIAGSVTLTLAGNPVASTITTSTVAMVESQSLDRIPATVSYNATTRRVTITPKRALAARRPHAVVLDGVKDQFGELLPATIHTFLTAAGAKPKITLNGTQVLFGGDFDGDTDAELYGYGNKPSPTKADILVRGTPTGPVPSAPFIGFENGLRPAVGDFDADGYDDVFLHAPGSAADLIGLGPDPVFDQRLAPNVRGTYTVLAGDFDGEGHDDLFFYAPGTTSDAVWWTGPTGVLRSATRSLTVNGTYRPVVGDFNGDDKDDILWHSPSSASDVVWYGRSDRTFTSKPITIAGSTVPLATDVDADGDDDLILYVAGTGADKLLLGGPTGFTSKAVSVSGTYKPVAGDIDGDGHGDVVWYAPGTAADPIWWGRPGGLGP